MILEDVIAFLKKNPPFQFLDDPTLKRVAGSLTMEFYPRDTIILKQDGPPSDSVWILKKGGVKVLMRAQDGEEAVMDYKGEGDNFGFLSMIGKDRQKTTVVTIDDTICYVLGREKVLQLLESNPAFAEYFMSYLSRYVDRTYSEMHKKSLLYGSADRLLFTTRVGDMATDVVTVDEDTTIREAALKMAGQKISSLIVLDKGGLPAGIVTDRDLREKVVAKGRDTTEPVKNIMTISLIRVDAEDFCFEAVLKMIKYNIHHILVIKDGALHGIMTNHDLMMLQGTSPLSMAHNVDNQQNIYGLVTVAGRMNNLLGLLLKEGAKAASVATIVTEINDRLVRRILEIAERRLGHPPVPYCWVALGAEGRREQVFRTDQDNAIIYADPDPSMEGEEKKYFSVLTSFVKNSLLQVGYPPCPQGYTADNAAWCQPVSVWKKYFAGWIYGPDPDAVPGSPIFFDLRPLFGKHSLAEELRDSFITRIAEQKAFLGRMANTVVRNPPPIGFLKSFVVERSGEHKDRFDLKMKGTMPLVDAVRLFALEKGIRETSTLGRLKALKGKHSLIEEYTDDLSHIFEFIMMLHIQHQFERAEEGMEPDNFINPNNLSTLEKKTLKEAFHLISEVQGLIIEKYKPFLV